MTDGRKKRSEIMHASEEDAAHQNPEGDRKPSE
jgi:hypothetical protein